MSLEARKLSILKHLAEIEDEALITQIENLIKPKGDWYDELSERQKASFQKGVEDSAASNTILYKDFIRNFKNRKNA